MEEEGWVRMMSLHNHKGGTRTLSCVLLAQGLAQFNVSMQGAHNIGIYRDSIVK